MNERSKRLENEKISTLLMNLSIPATVAMIVNASYNVVDTIFIGRGVGTLAIGGLAVAFPIQMFVMAFAMMIGVGAASAVSRSLGAKDMERADYVAGNSFLSIIILSSIVVALGLTFTEPLLRLFGASDTLLPFAKDYITIIFLGNVFFSFTASSNNLVRAEGNAKMSMFIMIIGTGLNIILDPIFIFVFDLGIKGAALATVAAQFISFIFILKYLYGGQSLLKVKLHHLKPQKDILKEIFTVGFASFARQGAGSVVAIVINNSLIFYGGELALSIYGVINRVIRFLFMPLFGVIQGMQPIVGFNYGARRIDRVKEVVKLSIVTVTALAASAVLVAEIFPSGIMSIFSNDPDLVSNGSIALRIVISLIPIIGVQIVGAALFQSLGKARPSLILALLRQVILFTPIVLILPRLFNLGLLGIWIAFPIADLIATIVTGIILRNEMRKISPHLLRLNYLRILSS